MIHFTVSIGVSNKPNTLAQNLLTEADALLYKAKENGRNQVVYDTHLLP